MDHALETALLRGVAGTLRTLPRSWALRAGAGLGTLLRWAGLRRRVALANLERAFPEREDGWRRQVLAAHYRELGRVAADYARLPALARAPREQVFASWTGEEHVHAARARGKGVVFLTGHFGHFELFAAATAQTIPVAILVKPLSNPGADAWLSKLRSDAGVELLPIGAGVRGALKRLRAGGAVAMVADQDARRDGVFVSFLGTPASTPTGPAWLSLASGAPIVFGTCVRGPDGRYDAGFVPGIVPEGAADDARAVLDLTRRHTALLEQAIRARPESWFWLHKRWKTVPPPDAGEEARPARTGPGAMRAHGERTGEEVR
jgi:KDO2-lipid IV(A) lauroyltransferase